MKKKGKKVAKIPISNDSVMIILFVSMRIKIKVMNRILENYKIDSLVRILKVRISINTK
jgi:hypothetical protein